MTLPLTPDVLRACYDFLNETSPFRAWNLPNGEDVSFRVVRDKANQGWCTYDGKKFEICVSARLTGHTNNLVELMCHVHDHHSGMYRGSEHSAAFKRCAAEVCRIHGFDPKYF